MTTEQIAITALGGLSSVVCFFLVRTMTSLDGAIAKASKTETEVALLKQEITLKHERLEEKLEELKHVIQDLTSVMKEFNARN